MYTCMYMATSVQAHWKVLYNEDNSAGEAPSKRNKHLWSDVQIWESSYSSTDCILTTKYA